MTGSDDDPFTRALRDDLPAQSDEARVRSRLVSAGVLAGAVAAPVGSAAAAAGVTAKVVALPLAVKVGASLAFVGLVSVPVVSHLASQPPSSRPSLSATAAARPLPVRKAEPRHEPVAAPLAAPVTETEPVALPAPAAPEPARPSLRERTKSSASTATNPLPSVAAFEDAAGTKPLDEGSLRAETALIERALSALKRDDIATARTALAEHARRFPNGHLVRERQRALERTLGKETESHAH
ncbi:MAG TPA: hypothetical protein VFV94_11540 [Polyangiaceae bacterium]|jgi:hypothetical protein|nr:hypothetical protein [Polyangiaceae bacterium]